MKATTKTRLLDLIDALVRIVLVGVVVAGGVVTYQWQEFAACVADYQDAAAESTRARSAAADQDRAAEDAMWQAFADAGDPTKVKPAEAQQYARAAFQKFLRERADARRQRADNPLPAPPSRTCK